MTVPPPDDRATVPPPYRGRSEAPEVRRARVHVSGIVAMCFTLLLLWGAVPEPYVPAALGAIALIGGVGTWGSWRQQR